jgi:PAS domain S-box-containing protein
MTDLVTPAETARAGQDQLCLDDEASLPLAHGGLSAEQLGVVLQHSFDIITVLEPDGTVRYTTPSAQRTSGYPEGVTIGRSGFDQIHPDDVGEVVDAFAECARIPGLSRRVQLRLRHADGHWITMEAVGNNLLDDPSVHGIVISAPRHHGPTGDRRGAARQRTTTARPGAHPRDDRHQRTDRRHPR